MPNPYADPDHAPPANLPPHEARRYEEAIVELMREASQLPDTADIEAIELEGHRPDTVLVLTHRRRGQLLETRIQIWENVESYERDGQQLIESAAWSGGTMWSNFHAEEFETRDVT